ncbi:hypothetical protein ACO2Q8_16760 [Larkinella sp. VNQ87]|uniref:hypothetical protein n=1 Tax=Larkinella sp. VNQ87 TaxID=3400921 RepID=UPI003C0C45B9
MMENLLTDDIKKIIQGCLFDCQSIDFNESRNSFSVKQTSGFVHCDQFLPLFETDVRVYINTVSIEDNELNAHFILYREQF